MKTLFVFVVVCICLSLGAVWQERQNLEAGEGKCISFSYPKMGVLNAGETKSVPNKCISITCHGDSHVSGHGCGVVNPPKGCILEDTDYSKPHPACCPTKFTC